MGIHEPFYPVPQWIVRKYGATSQEVGAWVWLVEHADTDRKVRYQVRQLVVEWGWSPKRILSFVRELVDQGCGNQTVTQRKHTELDFSRFYEDSGNKNGNTTETPRARSPLSLKNKNIPIVPLKAPEWLNEQAWQEWQQHRRELKKPITPSTANQQLAKLDSWRKQGYDPAKIIRLAIERGWQGLIVPDYGADQLRATGAPQERKFVPP